MLGYDIFIRMHINFFDFKHRPVSMETGLLNVHREWNVVGESTAITHTLIK